MEKVCVFIMSCVRRRQTSVYSLFMPTRQTRARIVVQMWPDAVHFIYIPVAIRNGNLKVCQHPIVTAHRVADNGEVLTNTADYEQLIVHQTVINPEGDPEVMWHHQKASPSFLIDLFFIIRGRRSVFQVISIGHYLLTAAKRKGTII